MGARVDGKVALVTGASRGIGREVARSLLAAGAAGVIGTGRHVEALDETAGELGERFFPVVGDVTDDAHAAVAVATAVERFGACDLLVNNAGTNAADGALTDVDMAGVDRTWAVNQRAPLVFSRFAWDAWMREHGGAIVCLGSVSGFQPSPRLGAYNVSKAALHHLTRQLAHELAPAVRVNAVAGGVVRTRLSRILWSWDEEGAAEGHPLHRLGEPEDIARAVLFLLSEEASWITGAVLPVDGGLIGAGSRLHIPG